MKKIQSNLYSKKMHFSKYLQPPCNVIFSLHGFCFY